MLHMFFAVPCEAVPAWIPSSAEALDLLFVLHADHEQNASTSTVRLAGSTGANPYAAISAGVSALWGPAHGGANEAVLAMLEQIGSVENIPKYLAMAKDKSSHFRLMGFGHRVYKNFDPRAKIIRAHVPQGAREASGSRTTRCSSWRCASRRSLSRTNTSSRASSTRTWISTRGIIYSAIGIPRSMFTVMFAIARTVGWVAHWQEMISDPSHADRAAAPALHRAATPARLRGIIGNRGRLIAPGCGRASLRLSVQRFELVKAIGALHGPAIDRAHGRLPDAVRRKHGCFDRLSINLEATRPDRRRMRSAFILHRASR